VHELANAEEQEVLRLWQGLGYYSRGRNLHFTAKVISKELNGQFPATYKELMTLKGVGAYTAAAIASFCYGESVPVVDGNVQRVLSRYFDLPVAVNTSEGEKLIKQLAFELIDPDDPATFNQAIMELGAIICTPKSPSCDSCPVGNSCLSKQNNTTASRPVKVSKKKIKNRYFHFAVIENSDVVLIQQRRDKDIWQNLFQFPLTETEDINHPKELFPGIQARDATRVSGPLTHLLSHQKIHAIFYHFDLNQVNHPKTKDIFLIRKEELIDYPIPRLIDKYLEKIP
jgi:A/G-specific adenine glycosylase